MIDTGSVDVPRGTPQGDGEECAGVLASSKTSRAPWLAPMAHILSTNRFAIGILGHYAIRATNLCSAHTHKTLHLSYQTIPDSAF